MLELKMKSENTFNKYWKFCVLIPKGEHMDQLKYVFIFNLETNSHHLRRNISETKKAKHEIFRLTNWSLHINHIDHYDRKNLSPILYLSRNDLVCIFLWFANETILIYDSSLPLN